MLPSQLLKEGSSLDIEIAQTAQAYTNKKQAEANAKARGVDGRPAVPDLSEADMLEMLRRAKEQEG